MEKNFPEVQFQFVDDNKTPEERKKEIEEMKRKAKELYEKMRKKSIDEYEEFTEMETPTIGERMNAGILGLAVGDALGVPVEFQSRGFLLKNSIKDMVGYGSHKVPAGTWSDDTSMALAAMDSIIQNKGLDYEDIMNKFSKWYKSAEYTATDERFDIGVSTRRAINNYLSGIPALECGMREEYENGNGSLMRILPFVYYLKANSFTEEEKTDIINKASSLTHAHETSRLGCKIYSDYVSYLLDGLDKYEALNKVRSNDYQKYYSLHSIDKYKRILKDDLRKLSMNDISSSGYVVSTLEASIWCTLKNNNYENAVIMAVNLGDDTDTVGAITGSINGVIYGERAIPERWKDKLQRKEYIEELSNQLIQSISHKKIR